MAKDYRNKPSQVQRISEMQERLAPRGLVPPQVVDLEESLLGAMMIDKSSANRAMIVIGRRTEDSQPFYRDAHWLIYRAMLSLEEDKEPIDLLTVKQRLDREGVLGNILGLSGATGAAYLVELTSKVVTTVNVESYARIIVEKSLARDLIMLCEEVKLRAFEGELDTFNLLDETDLSLQALRQVRVTGKGLKHAGRGWEDLWKEIQTPNPTGIRGLPFGVPDLDTMSGGCEYGEQIVLAAGSSRGKTQFAVHFARNTLINRNEGVAIFSLETTERKILRRFLIADSGVDRSVINHGNTDTKQTWLDLRHSIEAQKKLPLYIDDNGLRTTFDIRAELRKISSKQKIGLVIVDYLQLVDPTGKFETREREVTAISRQLRAIWKEFGVVGCVLSQFNRQQNDDREPTLNMLRESGAIEQDARKVVFLHYPYRKDDPVVKDVERIALILAKNDDGPIGSIDVDFHKHLGRFTEPNGMLDLIDQNRPENRVENSPQIHQENPPQNDLPF